MLLKEGLVDGYVAGATHTTGDNLRPGLQIIKATPGLKTVSSFFIMVHPNPKFGENGVMIYSDCGMVEMPTAEQLADIAVASARSWRQLVGTEPRVAMLSYSTKGSAKSTDTEKVLKALDLAKKADPQLCIDGEMQFDAAVIPSIGERKAKGSPVAGKANVFIFPDLDAGNIGYKITRAPRRRAGHRAAGPGHGQARPRSLPRLFRRRHRQGRGDVRPDGELGGPARRGHTARPRSTDSIEVPAPGSTGAGMRLPRDVTRGRAWFRRAPQSVSRCPGAG